MEAGGRPSNAKKLDKCNHWRDDGLAGFKPEVQRGARIDPWIDKFIHDKPLGSWKVEEAPEVAGAEWVSAEAKKVLTKIETQKKMELVDLFVIPHEVVTRGTADIVGWNEEDELWEIWDCKSGRQRDDYDLQLQFYALMLMDELNETEVRIRVAYCDLKLFQEDIVSRGDCETRIFDLIERIRIGAEPPVENPYCSECARQSVCPVWVVPAEEGLMIMNADMSPLLEPGLTPQSRLELIKKDPNLLGKFIDCWRKAATLVEKSGVEDVAKEMILAGTKVPGWKLVESRGRRFYDKEQITQILAEWGESASDFLSINKERYEGSCSNSDNDFLEPAGRNPSFHKLLRDKETIL